MVGPLKSKESPAQFNIRTLFPNKKDDEIANEAADYFMRISNRFDPLDMDELRGQATSNVIKITPTEVEERLSKCKKPKGLWRKTFSQTSSASSRVCWLDLFPVY